MRKTNRRRHSIHQTSSMPMDCRLERRVERLEDRALLTVIVSGSTIDVYSTLTNNNFIMIAGSVIGISDNGVQTTYSGNTINTVNFHGGSGNDSLTFTGTSAGEIAQLTANQGTIAGQRYTVNINSMANIIIHGGGGPDQGALYSGYVNDVFVGTPTTSNLVGSFYNDVLTGFTMVSAIGRSTGTHIAVLAGSNGAEMFVGTPTYAQEVGTGFTNTVYAFGTVTGLGGSGDTAYLYGDLDVDRSIGTSSYAQLSGTGFNNYATGFPTVTTVGYNSAGSAYQYGSSGNDTLIVKAAFNVMSGPGYNNIVYGFTNVVADATGSGIDTAALYGTGGSDVFVATPDYGMLTGTGISFTAFRFKSSVSAIEPYAPPNGAIAYLYDSSGNDTFTGKINVATFAGIPFSNSAINFGRVYAYSTMGGADTSNTTNLAYMFAKYGF